MSIEVFNVIADLYVKGAATTVCVSVILLLVSFFLYFLVEFFIPTPEYRDEIRTTEVYSRNRKRKFTKTIVERFYPKKRKILDMLDNIGAILAFIVFCVVALTFLLFFIIILSGIVFEMWEVHTFPWHDYLNLAH